MSVGSFSKKKDDRLFCAVLTKKCSRLTMPSLFIPRQLAIFSLTFLFLTHSITNLRCVVRNNNTALKSEDVYENLVLEETVSQDKAPSLRSVAVAPSKKVAPIEINEPSTDKNKFRKRKKPSSYIERFGADANPRHKEIKSYDPAIVNIKTTESLQRSLLKSCEQRPGEGGEGLKGYLLLEKVRQGLQEHREQSTNGSSSGARILCMVYTHSKNEEQIEAILNTWAQKCDGFFASSDFENRSLGILNLFQKGDESYDNMWQKTREMLFYAYENYRDSYDYFHV